MVQLFDMTTYSRIAVVLVVASFVGACGSAPADENDGRVHFNPLERDAQFSTEVPEPKPPTSLKNNEDLAAIVSGFRRRAGAFFQKKDSSRPIEEIERIFVSTGKYLQLVAIYQDVVDEQGVESPAAPRLAWALVRLGQRKQARALLDRLLEVQPDQPFVHFIDGAYWFERAPQSRRAAARALVAWKKILELERSFDGPRSLNRKALERKIEQMERRLGGSAEEILAAASDQREPEGTGSRREEGASPESTPGRSVDAGGRRADAGSVGTSDASESAPAEGRDAGPTAGSDAGAGDAEQRPVPVLVARADMALSNGELKRARRLYGEVVNERGVDSVEAKFGIVRVGERIDAPEKDLAQSLRSLLDHPDLSASIAHEMGLFARDRLERKRLAERFFAKVRQLDPEYAEQVGVSE